MKAVVFRIVAAVGLFLLITGTALYPVGFSDRNLPGLLSLAGAALLGISALANLKALVVFFKKRQARRGANAVFVTLLFTAILVIIQAISTRNTYRYDVTRNKRFTLSEPSRTLLDSLDGEISITAFIRKNTSAWRDAKAVLNMYQNQGHDVRYELVDPDEKPHVAQRYHVKPGEVIVEYNGTQRKADRLTEESLTNALLFASRDRRKVLYFVKGHDEKELDRTDATGLRLARQALENTGFLVHELSLLDVDSVPQDCSVLVVAGPKTEYLQTEADRIEEYLSRGGNALFLLDPRWPISRLKPILARYRVVATDYVLLDEVVVVDTGSEVFDATYTKIQNYVLHPITRGFRAITIFPMARPLGIEPDESDLSVTAQYLAITGRSAWGETDLNSLEVGSATRDETDIAPPLAVAVAAERTNKFDAPPAGGAPEPVWTSQIVVVGDSDFATNRFFRLLGNSDFFLNTVEYLAEEEIVIPIRPKKDLGDMVYISAGEGRLIFVLCLVLLPLMVASLGGYVVLRKRRT